jgi:thymidylate kinase
MIVALMGNDGTGKTSLANQLEVELSKKGYVVKYYNTFEHFLLKYLISIIFKFKTAISIKAKPKVNNIHSVNSTLFLKCWTYVVYFDCVVFYLYLIFRKKRINILDRYFYDFLISYEELNCTSKLTAKLFLTLPKPEIIYILKVDPQSAYERNKCKKDSWRFDIEYFNKMNAKYVRMAKTKQIKVINTKESIDTLTSNLKDEIIQRYMFYNRFNNKVSHWFFKALI